MEPKCEGKDCDQREDCNRDNAMNDMDRRRCIKTGEFVEPDRRF